MNYEDFFHFVNLVKCFFNNKDFMEVLTPPLVENPGMETHIHPFEVISKKDGSSHGYLNTSPEFFMKHLLAKISQDNIYTLNFSFRDEPNSPEHRKQFLMLEWYRKNKTYLDIIKDTQDLIEFCFYEYQKTKPIIKIITISEIFIEVLNFDILDFLDKEQLENKIRNDFKDIPLAKDTSSWAWDDFFFILFLNKIEPILKKLGVIILKDYPAPLAALSTIKKDDPRVCERFELYIDGVEIANCFNEVTSIETLKERFSYQNQEKKKLYHYTLPEPKSFYKTMENYPESSGIALGLERLYMCVTNQKEGFLSS